MRSKIPYNGTFDEARFFARATGALAVVTVFLYLRALLVSGFLSIAPITSTGMAAGVLLAVALGVGTLGLLAAWRWELAGGLLALLCAAAVAVITFDVAENGSALAAFVYASPLAIAGMLFVLHAWLRRPG